MEKIIQITLPDGSVIEESVIACEGFTFNSNPAKINIHLDPKPKKKRKEPYIQTEFNLE